MEKQYPQIIFPTSDKMFRARQGASSATSSSADGRRVVYPVAQNRHVNSILDQTAVPALVSDSVAKKAADVADRVMEVFAGVGTFCVELFLAKNGEVSVNEIAPRPHNSGHYTIEGCFANQFENHIRAIVGLPFGNVDLLQPTVMRNILGTRDAPATLCGTENVYDDPNVHLHLYGKSQSKPGRKLGHLTAIADTPEEAAARADAAMALIEI